MVRGNFHIHTNYSEDGYTTFRGIYKHAKRARLNVIAITDHDTITGAIRFIEWKNKKNIKDLEVIVGEEVTCSDGTHIIGLNIKTHISSGDPVTVVKAIKGQNGLVYFPHPHRHDGILSADDYNLAIGFGDFIEVFNGKVDHSYNEMAMETLKQYPHLAPLGGSDAHYNADVQKCICEFTVKEATSNMLFEYKKARGIKISGLKKFGSQNYFGFYYKHKDKLKIPKFAKELAKWIVPKLKNWKERNASHEVEAIYENFKE